MEASLAQVLFQVSQHPFLHAPHTTALRGRMAFYLKDIQAPSSFCRKHLQTLEASKSFVPVRQEACDMKENQTLLWPPSSEHHVMSSGLCLLVQVQVLTDPT